MPIQFTVKDLIERLQQMPLEAHVNTRNAKTDLKDPIVNVVLRTLPNRPPEWRYEVDLLV